MSEKEIVERVESIQTLCGQIANSMHEARKQGRMMSLEEARRLDLLSQELKHGISEVGPDPFAEINSPFQRSRVGELLGEIRSTLLTVADPEESESARTGRIHQAGVGSLKAYSAY